MYKGICNNLLDLLFTCVQLQAFLNEMLLVQHELTLQKKECWLHNTIRASKVGGGGGLCSENEKSKEEAKQCSSGPSVQLSPLHNWPLLVPFIWFLIIVTIIKLSNMVTVKLI